MFRYKYKKVIVKNKDISYDFYWKVYDSKYNYWFYCSKDNYNKPNPYFMIPQMVKYIKKFSIKLPKIYARNKNYEEIKLDDISIDLLKDTHMKIIVKLEYFQTIFSLVDEKETENECTRLIDNNKEIKDKQFIRVCERKNLSVLTGKEFYGYDMWKEVHEVKYIKVSNLKSYINRIYNRYCNMLSYI